MLPGLLHLWEHLDLALTTLVVVVLQHPRQLLVGQLIRRSALLLEDELSV